MARQQQRAALHSIAMFAALVLAACSSSRSNPAANGGTGGNSGGSAAHAGTGNAGQGGSAAVNGGGDGGLAQGGSAGTVSGAGAAMSGNGGAQAGQGGGGGDAGSVAEDASTQDASADAGDASSPLVLDTGWSDACGDVTNVGHCVGAVLEWCDYYARGLQQLDCGALGMTCHAGLMPNIDDEGSGCVGGPCVRDDQHCDDDLVYECRGGSTFVSTCQKGRGPTAACELYDNGTYMFPGCGGLSEACDVPFQTWCDGPLLLTCTEDGLIANDCEAVVEDGRCVVINDAYAQCDPFEAP